MRFRYRRVAVSISVVFLGISMVTLSTKMPTTDDSTVLEQVRAGEEDSSTLNQSLMTESVEQMPDMQYSAKSSGMESEDAIPVTAEDKGLEKNAYPEINELVSAYLNAKLECDEAKLAELVDDISYLDMKDIQKRTERIEEYTMLDCYTLAGPEENSYVVYVYSEVRVSGIDTLVSGLDGLYIRTDEMGKMTITMGEVSDEVQKQLLSYMEREDVAGLIAEVNEKFTAEVNGDEKLAKYYAELSVVDALEEQETSEETSEEESEETSGETP